MLVEKPLSLNIPDFLNERSTVSLKKVRWLGVKIVQKCVLFPPVHQSATALQSESERDD